ncbi:MAG: tetratricopeptide repeat protein [Tabrizicola sp.]|nr:tetratricopeptide repeat protein [Tabrizicola sp.]
MLRRLGLLLILWLGVATAALAEKRVALVIAAEDYDFIRPLANPANDARAIEETLEKLDFEVFVETNRDLKRTRRALEDFQQDAKGADVALLFFAGHGVAIDGVNYLLPTDADASSSQRLAETSLPLSEAQAAITSVAPIAIVLLDACRDDPFAGGGKDGRGAAALADDPPTAAKPQPGLGRIGRADGVLFAFSAAPNETAADGDGENSPFTAALVRHFGTAGVELKTALTLVQQDVYDRSRGDQLPYIESGLPQLLFISGEGVLPERDQLLMAMADVTPELRAEVEAIAAERGMPLAPLYAALLSADLSGQTPEERARLLTEAAVSYDSFQTELRRFQSDDPRVADLRQQAEEQLSLGAFDAARGLLTEAAEIDASARTTIRETYQSRTLSEAATHVLNANAARTDLRYDLAIEDLTKAVTLYAEVGDEEISREAKFSYAYALADLGDLQMVAGNSSAALKYHKQRSDYAQKQVEAETTDVDWVRELIWSLNSVGSVLKQQGYLKEAEAAYASAQEFSKWQSDRSPDDPVLMRDQEVARNNVGNLLYEKNDLDGALVAYREALVIAERLYELDPTKLLYRSDLSFTLERVGDALSLMGDKEGARAAFSRSLGIAEALAAEYPNDLTVRRNLSATYDRMGSIAIKDGDADKGLEYYAKSLAIREEMAALDPDNKPRQSDLALTFQKIGNINSSRGDEDSAILAYEAALAIRDRLAALDPTNMLWQLDLSYSHELLGGVYYGQGDLEKSLQAHEKARTIRAGIVMLDPDNLPRQSDYAFSTQLVGEIRLATGDRDGARANFEEALYLRRAIVAAGPDVVQYRKDVTVTLLALGDYLEDEGDLAGAEAHFAEAAEMRTGMLVAAPEDTENLRALSVAQNRQVLTLIRLGRSQEAVDIGNLSLEYSERLLRLAPDDTGYMRDRFVALERLGKAYAAASRHDLALTAYDAMVAQGDRLMELDPHSKPWAEDLALALELRGGAYWDLGDLQGALKNYEDCLNLRQWLVDQVSDSADYFRSVAWTYELIAGVKAQQNDRQGALPYQDQSLAMNRDLAAAFPDDVGYKISLVRSLELTASLLPDGTAELREGLAILQDLRATGALPPGYEEWIVRFRNALGLPKEF